MLPTKTWGTGGPWMVCCHWLGGSADTWALTAERLAERGLRCVAVDLPGFGAAAEVPGYSVRAMADAVIATVRGLHAGEAGGAPWLLSGHSMGGKIAAVVAREAANGTAGLEGLAGLMLVSPSPPGPEPMDERKRGEMLASLGEATGDAAADRKAAETFVTGNVGNLPLSDTTLAGAVNGVLRMNRAAWRAWLESGSKEDWRALINRLELPTLVVAGEADKALGPEAQRTATLPHFARGTLVALKGAGHLTPLERPGLLADHIVDFAGSVGLDLVWAGTGAGGLSERFRALLESERVAPQTRALMEQRLQPDSAAYEPQALDRHGLRTLRALVRRVVPGAACDLAARLDAKLATGAGEGWRPDVLPPDREAWRLGLLSLDAAAERAHGVEFVALSDDLQDALLEQACEGKLGAGLLGTLGLGHSADALAAAQMKLWFEDARGESTRLYMADPRTLERVGFRGFADQAGFTQIRLGEREVFER